tara:strand:+ start:93 stop:407 length:315 start_codon:yes stop_codon:yes gene_type:complete
MGIFNKKIPVGHFYVLYNLIINDEPHLKGLTIEVEYSDIKSDDEIIKIAERIIKNHMDTSRFDKTELLFVDRLHQISTSYFREVHFFTFMHPDLKKYLEKRKFN